MSVGGNPAPKEYVELAKLQIFGALLRKRWPMLLLGLSCIMGTRTEAAEIYNKWPSWTGGYPPTFSEMAWAFVMFLADIVMCLAIFAAIREDRLAYSQQRQL